VAGLILLPRELSCRAAFSLDPAFFIGQTADRPVKVALSAEVLASTKRVRTSF
jgi:hypothetical protein